MAAQAHTDESFGPTGNNAREIFLENYYAIESHNERYSSGDETYQKRIHPYAHLSHEQFVRYRTGLASPFLKSTEKSSSNISIELKLSLPENFNWVDKGVVRPVQNQGLCQCAYAFAAVGAIEGQLSLLGNDTKLSEQEVVDCARHYLFFVIPIVLGCNGGDDFAVYDYARKYNGLTSAENYPYQGKVNWCRTNREKVQGSRVRSFINVPSDEETMKQVLITRGPLYVTLYASPAFASYTSGIYTDPNGDCEGMESNHAALLVGYGEEAGQEYWIVKNSWGESYGEKGYVRVSRGVNLCNIANDASYPNLY